MVILKQKIGREKTFSLMFAIRRENERWVVQFFMEKLFLNNYFSNESEQMDEGIVGAEHRSPEKSRGVK